MQSGSLQKQLCPEDGGSRLPQNIDNYHIPKDHNLNTHFFENLKPKARKLLSYVNDQFGLIIECTECLLCITTNR
jgi:hypothetical protein